MKLTSFTGLAVLASSASAFPAIANEVAANFEARQAAPDPSKRFNAKKQFVPNTGEHKFIAPDFAAGDVRGPCPGLNAMANHGYLPRNGVGSHLDFITGTERAFGMSADLSGFLTVLGGTMDGNGLKWSIGGPTKDLPAPVGGLLGTPQGISGSHNKYECDASPGRGDLYTAGDDFNLQMDQYQILHDMAMENGDDIDLPLLTEFRSKRWDNSVKENPYFFNGPFTGVLVQPAAYTFIFRFMGNKSSEFPQGKLNTDIMNTFFGVKKMKDGSLKKIGGGGYERFPDNWYKRAIGDEYSIPFFQVDLALAGVKYPKFFSVGGNLGKKNSFTGVDIQNLTGGVYNTKTLSQGNNAMCFATQFLTQATPDLLACSGVLKDINGAMSKLTGQISKSFGSLSCPQISNVDNSQFEQFPGYSKINCKTGTYDS